MYCLNKQIWPKPTTSEGRRSLLWRGRRRYRSWPWSNTVWNTLIRMTDEWFRLSASWLPIRGAQPYNTRATFQFDKFAFSKNCIPLFILYSLMYYCKCLTYFALPVFYDTLFSNKYNFITTKMDFALPARYYMIMHLCCKGMAAAIKIYSLHSVKIFIYTANQFLY